MNDSDQYHVGVRPGRTDDLPVLPEIERAAGEAFRDLGMDEIADDVLPTVPELAAHLDDDRLWVAVDDRDVPVAYAVVLVVDGHIHVEQVSVHPDHARHGVGRRLLDSVTVWSQRAGYEAMTLTTFRDVPWNAPYYARLGWHVVNDELGPAMAAIRQNERDHGLDRWPRVVMWRWVSLEGSQAQAVGDDEH